MMIAVLSTYYNGDQLSKTPLQKKKTFHILKVCIIRGKSHGAMMMSSSPQAPLKFYKRRNKVLSQAYLSLGLGNMILILYGIGTITF